MKAYVAAPPPDPFTPQQPLRRCLVLGGLLVALYALVGSQSWGFDDEILMLKAVARSPDIGALSRYMVEQDVHPLGSYLIVWVFTQVGMDPSAIRAVAGTLSAVSLIVLWTHVAPRSLLAASFSFLVICLNPTLLLWGATLRWYSWSIPVLAAMLVLLIRNPASPWRFWGPLAAGGAILAHLGYANLLVLPGILLAGLFRRRGRLFADLPALAAATLAFMSLVLPQILLILPQQVDKAMTVHGQGLARRLAGLGLHAFGGQASMPFGLSAIAFGLGNLGLLAMAIHSRALRLTGPGAAVLLPGLAAFFAAGLTGHFRTLVVLSPAQAVWQAGMFARTGIVAQAGIVPQGSRQRARLAIAGLFVVGTVAGLWNVIRHEDTSKAGWNRPMAQIFAAIRTARATCTPLTVVTIDPVLSWHLDSRGWDRLTFGARDPAEVLATHPGCLLMVHSHHRDLTPGLAALFAEGLDRRGSPRTRQVLGPDRHAAFKRQFDPRIPDHAVVLELHGSLP